LRKELLFCMLSIPLQMSTATISDCEAHSICFELSGHDPGSLR
jgi:hypothetical protein